MDACCFGSEMEHGGAVTFDSSDLGGIAWGLVSERAEERLVMAPYAGMRASSGTVVVGSFHMGEIDMQGLA